MSTTAASQPIVPPRPARSTDTPKVPQRPSRRHDRSVSPSRFAPSPLNDVLAKGPTTYGHSLLSADPIDRTGSVDLPSLGEEGLEYEVVEELELRAHSQAGSSRAASPEHTRTVGDDLKLHAPRPSLPASSAKQRVAAVTRTDSDKAASYGIGRRASSDEASLKKKKSTTSQVSSEDPEEEEQGIPEIGVQVPMYPNAGDVQAPSPAPGHEVVEPAAKKSHVRRKSNLPPGSYGLHGHGILPSDKLEQAYYSKHPELAKKEHKSHHADRVRDDSMTSDALNKIVRETAHHGTGLATHDINGTPSEQVGWQAIEESVSRPASVAPKGKANSFSSQSSAAGSVHRHFANTPDISLSGPPGEEVEEEEEEEEDLSATIHIEDPRRRSVMFNDDETAEIEAGENQAPVLALDEVAKDPSAYEHEPAVEPSLRRGSSYEESSSRPVSRAASRPSSIFKGSHISKETDSAAVEDDYEPLFAEKQTSTATKSVKTDEATTSFPSRDIWEDAPSSVHHTAEVTSVPAPAEPDTEDPHKIRSSIDSTRKEGETPAQAFARRQEELAEKELQGEETFSENRTAHKSTPRVQQPHLSKGFMAAGIAGVAGVAGAAAAAVHGSSEKVRPSVGQRFPSRDVWEDAPESLQLETTVSGPQEEETQSPIESPAKPEVPHRPLRKLTDPAEKAHPAVPSRPKPKTTASSDSTSSSSITKPTVPERPKPHVPTRPVRHLASSSSTDKEAEAAPRQKPAVPSRPVGGKIAALQANFMSDLNKKLKIGPQAPKKEEPEAASEEAKEVLKAPLADARKGRARGPQRRAPAAAAAPASSSSSAAPFTLGFSATTTLYSIDEEGFLNVSGTATPKAVEKAVEVEAPKIEEKQEKIEEPVEVKPAEKIVEKAIEIPDDKPVEKVSEEEEIDETNDTTEEKKAAAEEKVISAEKSEKPETKDADGDEEEDEEAEEEPVVIKKEEAQAKVEAAEEDSTEVKTDEEDAAKE